MVGVIPDMQWRRGLLLALINLCIAVPFIVREEVREWRYLDTTPSHPSEISGDDVVGWDPCVNLDVHYNDQVKIAGMTNLPAATLSGWRMLCPARFTLAFEAEQLYGKSTRKAALFSSSSFCILIAVQWLIVGSFPLVRPSQKWLEPGFLITICAVVAGAMSCIPPLGSLCLFPMLIVFLAWFVLLAFVLVKSSRKAWTGLRRRLA